MYLGNPAKNLKNGLSILEIFQVFVATICSNDLPKSTNLISLKNKKGGNSHNFLVILLGKYLLRGYYLTHFLAALQKKVHIQNSPMQKQSIDQYSNIVLLLFPALKKERKERFEALLDIISRL